MWRKVLAIAWNGLYRTYTDRVALLFMFVLPVALSTIIGLAFGAGENDITLDSAELILINQDQGATMPQGEVNQGRVYEEVLVTNVDPQLTNLVQARTETDVEAARQQVEDGDVRAALIIPPDFTAQALAGNGQVELFYNPGAEISATVIIAIVDQITAQINAGQVAQNILVGQADGYFVQQANGDIAAVGEAADEALTQLYSGEASSAVQLRSVNVEGEVESFDSLSYFAPSMAIFFMTFAMAAGTRSILEEQRDWTLQRIMTTPTPRWVYMLGRLLGTYFSGLLQMLLLLLITMLMAVLLGRDPDIWGNSYLALALVVISVVAAGTGLGLLIAALSKTVAQADNVSSAVLMLMAIVGGTFIPVDGVPILDALRNLSLNNWGLQGFNELTVSNGTLSDVILNVVVLLLMAVAYFVIALWRFNKRLDV